MGLGDSPICRQAPCRNGETIKYFKGLTANYTPEGLLTIHLKDC